MRLLRVILMALQSSPKVVKHLLPEIIQMLSLEPHATRDLWDKRLIVAQKLFPGEVSRLRRTSVGSWWSLFCWESLIRLSRHSELFFERRRRAFQVEIRMSFFQLLDDSGPLLEHTCDAGLSALVELI